MMIPVCRMSIGTKELQRDVQRIEDGELELPRVSSVEVTVNGKTEEAIVWLDETYLCRMQ